MTLKKRISVGSIGFLSLFLIWYFAVKESDYCISFKVKAATGTVFQGIQEWTAAQLIKDGEKYTFMEKRDFEFIKQKMEKENVQMEYVWDITSINDSITKLSVGIKDLNQSWYNKITVPFYNTDFKKAQIRKITDFKKGLDDHLQKFKVVIDGETSTKEVYVAYISLESVLQRKAQNMIASDALITGFLYNNNIEIKGKPYLEITNWDLENETLQFNYCFPVDKNTKVVFDEVIKFKSLPAFRGLKATYYGNFRTSDRAWFALLDYAKRKNIKLKHQVLEHFLANPFNGGDELQWKTEIMMPFTAD
jgi:effector-binding domain-containing protein